MEAIVGVGLIIGAALIAGAIVTVRTFREGLREYDRIEESLQLWEDHCPDKENCPDVMECAEEIRWELGYRGYI